MENLKSFMMMFRFEPIQDYQPTEEELNGQQQKWGTWIGGIAAQAKLVDTNQLGFEGKLLYPDLSVKDGIYVSENKTLGGNMIVRAASIDQAMELAKGCPILEMGGFVEVRDIVSMKSQ